MACPACGKSHNDLVQKKNRIIFFGGQHDQLGLLGTIYLSVAHGKRNTKIKIRADS